MVNGGALSHYGWALHDALATFDGSIVEVHISNTSTREAWRHTSVLTPVANGTIMGLGPQGYELAAQAVVRLLSQ